MRLIRGPTLKDMILSRELDPGRSLRLLAQVADALDTAHDAGLTTATSSRRTSSSARATTPTSPTSV